MLYSRICKTCAKEFTSTNRTAKNCSYECKNESQRSPSQIEMTPELVKSHIEYDPINGQFHRLDGSRRPVSNLPKSGLIRINLFNHPFTGGQLAYIIMTGEFPPRRVIFKNKSGDYRWNNLVLIAPTTKTGKQAKPKKALRISNNLCPVCNEIFEVPWARRHKKFCSEKCQHVAQEMPEELTIDFVRANISYDPLTGFLVRRYRGKWTIIAKPTTNRYVHVSIAKHNFPAHRLIWAYMTGEFPPDDMVIDHINRVKHDNRWENLRLATHKQNSANSGVRAKNKTGYKGVSFDRETGTWVARATVWGLASKEEAAKVYNKLALVAHGEFAYLNKIPTGKAIKGRPLIRR